MEIRPIEIPRGIKYISDWKEYSLPKNEHCIVDKGVTGCGYTEFCLRNNENIVLCSPRKLLLENKRDQHKEDQNILYLENEIKGFEEVKGFDDLIDNHLYTCQWALKKAVKFMVTYDSLHYVVRRLGELGLLGSFIFVVDEFQSIFLDAFFKASTEFDFVQTLQVCPSVIYLSATPMLDDYLCEVPEFADLPFYKMDWKKTGYVENIKIQRKRVRALPEELDRIISRYERGEYETLLDDSGNVVESKEVVLYFNSVNDILKAVKKHGLTPKNTLIICADTPENRKKLKKLGFEVGRIPLEGEPNPKYMFCTATTYVGVDMYSVCASTFVFADPNIDSLAMDISLDLPQIAGRQRNRENPFKNNITVIYKTTRKEISEEEFKEKQAQRRESTQNLLDVYNNCTDRQKVDYLLKLKDSIQVSKYSRDFVSISKDTNAPVYNKFIEIADKRAWKVTQKDYQDSISVTRAFQEAGYEDLEEYSDDIDRVAQDFLDNHFYSTGLFTEKMRLYCEFMDQHKDNKALLCSVNARIPDPVFEKYYKFYGTQGCSARMYRRNELEKGFIDYSKEDMVEIKINSSFVINESYLKSNIKLALQKIYDSLGIKKTAKATDLEKYFKIERVKITSDGKRKEGFRLVERL